MLFSEQTLHLTAVRCYFENKPYFVNSDNLSHIACIYVPDASMCYVLISRSTWYYSFVTHSLSMFDCPCKAMDLVPIVRHPPTDCPAKSTHCLAYFSLLFGKGAYPMKYFKDKCYYSQSHPANCSRTACFGVPMTQHLRLHLSYY